MNNIKYQIVSLFFTITLAQQGEGRVRKTNGFRPLILQHQWRQDVGSNIPKYYSGDVVSYTQNRTPLVRKNRRHESQSPEYAPTVMPFLHPSMSHGMSDSIDFNGVMDAEIRREQLPIQENYYDPSSNLSTTVGYVPQMSIHEQSAPVFDSSYNPQNFQDSSQAHGMQSSQYVSSSLSASCRNYEDADLYPQAFMDNTILPSLLPIHYSNAPEQQELSLSHEALSQDVYQLAVTDSMPLEELDWESVLKDIPSVEIDGGDVLSSSVADESLAPNSSLDLLTSDLVTHPSQGLSRVMQDGKIAEKKVDSEAPSKLSIKYADTSLGSLSAALRPYMCKSYPLPIIVAIKSMLNSQLQSQETSKRKVAKKTQGEKLPFMDAVSDSPESIAVLEYVPEEEIDCFPQERLKRKYEKKEPVRANFETEGQFNDAHTIWRELRNKNNKAVRRSRNY